MSEIVTSTSALSGILERREAGLVVLSRSSGPVHRRVLFVNNYGGEGVWQKIKAGHVASHHLWGCLELVRMGYEVALADALPDFSRRRPLPHDLSLLGAIVGWLRRDDIVYCGHNVLFYVPFLRSLQVLNRKVVSLLFARETLAFADGHSAIIALTPTAALQAARIAPRAKVAHLGWGVSLESYPQHVYAPEYMLHCGIAGRDFDNLYQASTRTDTRIRIIAAWPIDRYEWPANVEVINSGPGYNHEAKKVSLAELLNEHYASSAASLIVTLPNPEKDHALGFTNMIEAMAMGQPIIHTRTGALADEIDVEKAGCGLAVPPGDPSALAEAMRQIVNHPREAAEMGRMARKLCEARYNIDRYAARLHELFESL